MAGLLFCFQLFLKKQHTSPNSCRAKIIVPAQSMADICYRYSHSGWFVRAKGLLGQKAA
jgi:hypothetical protein